MSKKMKYNLHGYMIEFNPTSRLWTWSKFDSKNEEGETKVVRRTGFLQFKKMFRSVFEGGKENMNPRSLVDIDNALEKNGVDYIFLFQGPVHEEDRFASVAEAEKHYQLDQCPHWDLTDYFFGFDNRLNSWAMYDAFTGALQFTPAEILAQRSQYIRRMQPQVTFAAGGYVLHQANQTVH